MSVYADPWTKAVACKPALCHYGCGMQASLREPGKPWAAHKVCMQGEDPSVPPVRAWDGEDHKLVEERPVGCGTPGEHPKVRGRFCAGTGQRLECQLCPQSPTYWNPEGRALPLWVELPESST